MDVIRITLHSDLCAGNGESRGNAVDTDIVLTAAGLPRIPARRLKGCLRAAAGELAALGDEAAAYTAELFGDKVGRQGCLWVGDAALPQEAAFTAWLKQNPAWADHSRVEQLYTDVRGQTRLKDGVADDGSLRFTRVLGQYDPLDKTKALVFEAPVRLENASPEAVRLLEHCCAATRHMGTHRNRGPGQCAACVHPRCGQARRTAGPGPARCGHGYADLSRPAENTADAARLRRAADCPSRRAASLAAWPGVSAAGNGGGCRFPPAVFGWHGPLEPADAGNRRGSFLPSSACAGLPEKRWCIC